MRALALVLVLLLGSTAGYAQPDRKPVRFDVPVVPEAAKYLDLLRVPGYAALALQNNGLSPSLSSRLVVKDPEGFQIRAGVLRYTGKRDNVYLYEAGLNLSLGLAELTATVPVEVDTGTVSRGTLIVRVYPPLASALPQQLLERIDIKIRSVSDIHSQRKVLAYLDRLAAEQQAKGHGFDGLLQAIALDAYNSAGPAGPVAAGRGGTDSVSDILMLVVTVAVWLIGFPIFLFFARRRRKVEQPG
jgi:hypothetical protein